MNNRKYYTSKLFILIMLVMCQCLSGLAVAKSVFPQPSELKPDITFWTRVYTEITTGQGFIHDNARLGVVYEKIDIKGLSAKQRKRKIKAAKDKYIKILNQLATGKRSNLSAEARRVLKMWPSGTKKKEFKVAKGRVRFQLGQADKFKEGLARSGRWKPYILKTLRDMNLPAEIYSLPQVESSFNHKAYSRVGAAGMWQFMRSTGRRFMRVDHVVDERLDPFISTVAAARLLQQNHKTTGAWPLAITAYNHGAAGMRRAARQVGSKDIVKVVRRYRSRTFKFASRNFYVAFLAAVNIHKNPEKYFGKINYDAPEQNIRYKLPGYIPAQKLASSVGISVKQMKLLNPALRPNVWSGNKFVPKGYQLRVPSVDHRKKLVAALSGKQKVALKKRQKPDVTYRVRRGDSLSTIAKRFKVSVRDLMAFNNLRKSNYIRVGQVLRLPQKGGHKAPPREIRYGQYTVRAGDTISLVAQNFGVSVESLMALNGLTDKNMLVAGQTLRVKGKPVKRSAENPQNYEVRAGDTLSEIADKFNIPEKTLMALNGLTNRNKLVPNQVLRLTAAANTNGDSDPNEVAATTTRASRDLTTYTVKKGDSLISIANSYNISLAELLAVNDVRRRDVLRIGYALKVPKHLPASKQKRKPQEYTVRKGDTLSVIAQTFGLAQSDLMAINGLTTKNVIVPGQVLRLTKISDTQAPALDYLTYKVKKGDSLISIANQHYVSLQELLAVNDVRKRNVLRIGQTLKVPKIEAAKSTEKQPEIDVAGQSDNEPAITVTTAEAVSPEQAPALDEAEAVVAESQGMESDEEAEHDSAAGVTAVASHQPLLAADPNDYAVSDDNKIIVLAGETLGHYADWLQIKTNDLRRLNRMSFKKPVVIGQSLKLKFRKINKEKFEANRLAFHSALQATYFEQFSITGTQQHTVKSGDSIWSLTQQQYKIPLWLLVQYNPELVLHKLKPGDKLIFPSVQAKSE